MKVGLSTSIKVVIALLQHNALSNPALCISVLDILLDALQRLPPLSLNETEMYESFVKILSVESSVS